MSVQKKEKAMWEMLDRFFLRVLGEKEGTGDPSDVPGDHRGRQGLPRGPSSDLR